MSGFRTAYLQAVHTRLDTISDATVYLGQVDSAPPTLAGDTEGHVAPYVVIYPSPGSPLLDEDLAGTTQDLEVLFQVTCVAAFALDLLALVDRVDTLLHRWVPTVSGVTCGQLRPPPGYNPGPARVDDTVRPNRLYLPLQYQGTATT